MLLTGVNLLLRLISTSFQVYISGRIGAAGIGLLQLVMSVGSLAMTAGIAGIRTATMYLTAEELGHRRPGNVTWVLSGCMLYSILCSGLVAGLLYSFAPVLAQAWIGQLNSAFAVSAAFVFAGHMAVTMSFLLLWAGDDPVRACESMIYGSGISACLTLLCLVLLRLRERTKVSSRIPVRSRLLQTAVPLALADNLKAGISTTENLMVPKRLKRYPGTHDPLAAFGMVCGMVFPVLMFPAAILFGLAELLIPELARCSAAGSNKRIRYLAKRSLHVAMLYGCTFAGLEFLLAEKLCLSLYQNPEAGKYLKLYALLIPMLYCDAITDAMTKGLGQQKACVRYNIITSSMDVGLLYLILPKYGMMGYFFSFLVTHMLNFILSLRRLLKITGPILSPATPMLTILATLCAIWIASHIYAPVLCGLVFVLIFICLLVLLRVIRREELPTIPTAAPTGISMSAVQKQSPFAPGQYGSPEYSVLLTHNPDPVS